MTAVETLVTEFVFEAVIAVGPMVDLGPGPLGPRRMVPILSGSIAGPKIKGKILPGGIDWQLMLADNVTVIEAHYTLQTDDGVLIRVINKGFRRGPAEVMKRLAAGEPVDPAEYYFRAAPVFDAPSGRYDWLNRSLFVSSGVRTAASVVLRFYQIL
jgi:hypothetical protein